MNEEVEIEGEELRFHPLEIHEKLDTIIRNQEAQKDKYLSREPYEDMLRPGVYFYRHPGRAIFAAIIIVDGLLDLARKGLITAFINYLITHQ